MLFSSTPTPVPAVSKERSSGALAIVPALAVALLTLGASLVTLYAPPAQGEMAVVFPPGTSEGVVFAAIRDAGGGFVAPSRFSNIVVAFGRDPGFAARIRAHGALFLLAAHGLCGPVPLSSTAS
jgi:hypothetical protein